MNAYYRMTALIHLNFTLSAYCSSHIQCEHFLTQLSYSLTAGTLATNRRAGMIAHVLINMSTKFLSQ
jgi:hypothetical protein